MTTSGKQRCGKKVMLASQKSETAITLYNKILVTFALQRDLCILRFSALNEAKKLDETSGGWENFVLYTN